MLPNKIADTCSHFCEIVYYMIPNYNRKTRGFGMLDVGKQRSNTCITVVHNISRSGIFTDVELDESFSLSKNVWGNRSVLVIIIS